MNAEREEERQLKGEQASLKANDHMCICVKHFCVVLISGLRRQLHSQNPLQSTKWVPVDAGIQTRGRWVRSANAASLQCGPPPMC